MPSGKEISEIGLHEEKFICDLLNNNKELLEKFSKFIEKKIGINDVATTLNDKSKTDITLGNTNIQHKKTKHNRFGQVHTQNIKHLIKNIPELKKYDYIIKNLCHNKIKINTEEYDNTDIISFLNTIDNNKEKILKHFFCGSDILKCPEIFSISIFINKIRKKIIFWKMTDIITELSYYKSKIRESGTVIEISKGLTLQRRGGSVSNSNNYQIKFIPTMLSLDKSLVFNF